MPYPSAPTKSFLSEAKDSFFIQDAVKVIEDGNFNVVPTMIGLTKDEGILGSAWFYNNLDKFREFWYVRSW